MWDRTWDPISDIGVLSLSSINNNAASIAGCTLSPSAFGESLERELPETRLGACDFLHSCQELSILLRDTRRQPGETQDPLTRASQTAKKVIP